MLAMTAKQPELAHETIPNVLPLPLKRRVASNGIVIDGASQLTPSVYAPREDLFLEGDDATHLVEVVEGVVCAYRLLPDGHRHVVSFYFPGDLIGYCCSGSQTLGMSRRHFMPFPGSPMMNVPTPASALTRAVGDGLPSQVGWACHCSTALKSSRHSNASWAHTRQGRMKRSRIAGQRL